jgi:hypothetical protein
VYVKTYNIILREEPEQDAKRICDIKREEETGG